MRLNGYHILIIPLFLALSSPLYGSPEDEKGISRIRSAVVKIKNIAQRPNYNSPWKDFNHKTQSGSGFIIDGQRILTNAHLVSNSKYLEVEKENSATPYQAVVSFIGHDCDLAILEVTEKSFFEGTSQLEFSKELPKLQSTVLVYGFPVGGQRISVTRGVVSRIDYASYRHSGSDAHLIIQIDAALNKGNSGGPVIQEGKVIGVAFQFGKTLQNIGHAIPITIIDHFLEDIADGKYDRYPELGLYYSALINEDYRRYAGLVEGQTGVIVSHVTRGGSSEGSILPHDVLTSIDGHPIRNDGTIFIEGQSYDLAEVVERKQVGKPVEFELVRQDKTIHSQFPLKGRSERMNRSNTYDLKPEYFIFGGLIFQPLSMEYLKTWPDDWWNRANKRLLYYYDYYFADKVYLENPEPVVLTRVLSAPVNRYYTGITDMVVKKANGKEIKFLSDLVEALEGNTGAYHVIEFDGSYAPCVLDAKRVEMENAEILKRYGIMHDRYLAEGSSGVSHE